MVLGAIVASTACGESARSAQNDESGPPPVVSTSGVTDAEDGDDERLDVGEGSPPIAGCDGDSQCKLIDVLFVIDNSATMAEEQRTLANNMPLLVERLRGIVDEEGAQVKTDVHVMLTTTDLGHPLCTDFQVSSPAQGSPVFESCGTRLSDFGNDAEVCTERCPEELVPGGDPYLQFDRLGSNVPFNDITGAIGCIAPQGTQGCGYEAPLEAMLQALRPDACWNDPQAEGCSEDERWGWVSRGFLRPGSTLAIALLTDEADCSVAAPAGSAFFTQEDNTRYWAKDPRDGLEHPSSAICWNAGVECDEPNANGNLGECRAIPNPDALHPPARYKDFLRYLREERSHDVVMLGVLGVPAVTEHSDSPPYEPVQGGAEALRYRAWREGEYDGTAQGGDILPKDHAEGIDAALKTWEFGVGPGCTVVREPDSTGEGTGTGDGTDSGGREVDPGRESQAIPPVRILDVCRSLDGEDDLGRSRIRCCVESICDDDFSNAMRCLAGVIRGSVLPEE